MLKLIQEPADLPQPGTSHEMARMEFKRELSAKGPVEHAKDVAAFANSVGGTILVGAERDGERLEAYRPMTKEHSGAAMKAYDEAVRDRCSPKPLVEIHEIALDDGFVLAVNVWAFPGQPVGVLVGEKSEGTYRFPLRSGAQTVFLTPDQLPMMMLPEVRRVAILLSQIPKGEKLTLSYFSEGPTIQGSVTNRFARELPVELASTLDEIIMRNTVEFLSGAHRVALPADAIDHVWRGIAGWCISTQFTLVSSPEGMMARPTV
jgi:hypothetical protein